MPEILSIPAGARIFLGQPATPMPDELVQRLRGLVQGIDAVREAHLPQCYSPTIVDPPNQVLVLVCDGSSRPDVVAKVSAALPASFAKERINTGSREQPSHSPEEAGPPFPVAGAEITRSGVLDRGTVVADRDRAGALRG